MNYWVVVYRIWGESVIRERFKSVVVVASNLNAALDAFHMDHYQDGAEVIAVIPTGD